MPRLPSNNCPPTPPSASSGRWYWRAVATPPIANVIGRFAGLDARTKAPTAAEVQRLAAEVTAKGDAARGEHSLPPRWTWAA